MSDQKKIEMWNYRVVRKNIDGEVLYEIHEAYYGRGENLISITDDGVGVSGGTFEELLSDARHYLDALEKPILDFNTLEIVTEERGAQERNA